MKLEKRKLTHPLPDDLADIVFCGIEHPKERNVTLMMVRVSEEKMNHIVEGHDGPIPTGVPNYYAVGIGAVDKTLTVYPPPSQDMEIVGDYIVRKKL